MNKMIKFPDMFSSAAGKISTVEGSAASKQAIKCALHTAIGELFGGTRDGSSIKQYLFEMHNAGTQYDVAQEIKAVASKYAPDIVVETVSFEKQDPISTKMGITIHYYVKSAGISDSTTIEY